jgi:hypothetical protein
VIGSLAETWANSIGHRRARNMQRAIPLALISGNVDQVRGEPGRPQRDINMTTLLLKSRQNCAPLFHYSIFGSIFLQVTSVHLLQMDLGSNFDLDELLVPSDVVAT